VAGNIPRRGFQEQDSIAAIRRGEGSLRAAIDAPGRKEPVGHCVRPFDIERSSVAGEVERDFAALGKVRDVSRARPGQTVSRGGQFAPWQHAREIDPLRHPPRLPERGAKRLPLCGRAGAEHGVIVRIHENGIQAAAETFPDPRDIPADAPEMIRVGEDHLSVARRWWIGLVVEPARFRVR
jgi:hypothetical protein